MRAGWLLLSAIALSSISSVSSASPKSDAFAQGSSMGNGAVQGMFSGINPSTAQTNIPGYGGSVSTQSGYFSGGNGNIEAPGAAQITNCANAAPGSNQMANQYCNAVNFLAINPSVRPQITISQNDSMLVHSRTISNYPTLVGSSSQCVPVTTTTPAQYTTKMCSTVQGMNLAQCVLGRVVNINDYTNYKCNQTMNAYQTNTCNKVTAVSMVLKPESKVPPQNISSGIYWDGTNVQVSFSPWGWAPGPLYLSPTTASTSASISLYYAQACCATTTGSATISYNNATQKTTVTLSAPPGGMIAKFSYYRAGGYYFYCSSPYYGGCQVFYNGSLIATLATGARYPSSGYLKSVSGYSITTYYAYNTVTFSLFYCPAGTIQQGSQCLTPQSSVSNGCGTLQTAAVTCSSTFCTCPNGSTWNGVLPPGTPACN